jgi:beta-lactamase regulating signal transducer with metallopeptidase domain
MLLTVFEKNYFLLALGWGIINSIWQTGFLWLMYKSATLFLKDAPAVLRYRLSLLFLTIALLAFIVTSFQAYLTVQGSGNYSFVNISLQLTQFHQKFILAFQLVSCLYLVFLLLKGLQFFKHLKELLALKSQQFIKAPVTVRLFVARTAAHLGINKKVEVWLSKKVDVPCITGYLKPLILLPVSILNNLDTAQTEAIIIHELAHIKRNDYLFNLIQSFIELILFFNPFAILLGKAARKERENCCDDWVLNYQFNRHDYARALLILEERRQFTVQLALAATNGKKRLLLRVKRLFIAKPVTDMNVWHRLKLAGIGSMGLFAILMLMPDIQTTSSPDIGLKKLNVQTINSAHQLMALRNENIKSLKIINSQPYSSVVQLKTKQEAPQKIKEHETEFSDALINEELLTGKPELQTTPIQVAEKDAPVIEYLVKIEEERSGSKNKISYVLEYRKVNDQVEIKPLVIINKKKTSNTQKVKAAAGVKPVTKKSITS